MPVVTAINIPEGVDGKVIRGTLLNEFGIEIATSFGPLDGKILRIGNMGYSSQKRNILILLGALEAVMLQNHVKMLQAKVWQQLWKYTKMLRNKS